MALRWSRPRRSTNTINCLDHELEFSRPSLQIRYSCWIIIDLAFQEFSLTRLYTQRDRVLFLKLCEPVPASTAANAPPSSNRRRIFRLRAPA